MAIRTLELNLKMKKRTQLKARLKSLRAKAKQLREDETKLQEKLDAAATEEEVTAI